MYPLASLMLAACAHQPVMVQMAPRADVPGHLTRWHPEPFGHPALASELGLDRWYYCRGAVPAEAVAVEPIYTGSVASVPNDPLFNNQYALNNHLDTDIQWLPAWELIGELQAAGVTFQTVRISIVDSRFDFPEPKFDDLPVAAFYNTMNNTTFPSGGNCVHSIHVGSIAAARVDNELGISGVCPFAMLQHIQVLTGCYGDQMHAAAGVLHATDTGASVVNMSLQYGYVPQTILVLACEYARQSGTVVVAAAGNFYGQPPTVPASIPTVISVSALGRDGNIAGFSNVGAEISAPGELILGLGVDWFGSAVLPAWVEWSGTSMASPHVAGAAALLKSRNPALSPEAIRAILNETADDIGDSGYDKKYGSGRLNLYRALIAADPCSADFDRDGALTAADFAAFQSAFVAGRRRADCNGDQAWTVADFACFQTRFAVPCR